jgi:hypothetical protein
MPILAVTAQAATSAHFLEIGMFRAGGVAFGNATLLKVLGHKNSEQGLSETHANSIIDQSAVKNAFWNLRSKVAKYL